MLRFVGLLAVLTCCAATLSASPSQLLAVDRINIFSASSVVQVTCPASNLFLEASSSGLYLYQRSSGGLAILQSLTGSTTTSINGGAMDSTGNKAAVIFTNAATVRVFSQIQSGFSTSNDVSVGSGVTVTAVQWISDKIIIGLSTGGIGVITKDTTGAYLASGYKSVVLHAGAVNSLTTNTTHFASSSASEVVWGNVNATTGTAVKLLQYSASGVAGAALTPTLDRTYIGLSGGNVQSIGDFNYSSSGISSFNNQKVQSALGGSLFGALSDAGLFRLWGRNDKILDRSSVDISDIAGFCWTPTGDLFITKYIPSSALYSILYDCTTITNSNSANTAAASCTCDADYFWNENLCYKNCSIATLDNGVNVDANSCSCKGSAKLVNDVCSIDCNSDTFSSGGTVTEACTCIDSAIWNSTLLKCQIDCTKIAYSANRTVSNSVDTCICSKGFKWSNSLCVRDCSLIPHGVVLIDVSECTCSETYAWNGTTCVKDCSQDDYSNKTATSNGEQCNCITDYYWNSTLGGCSLNCSSVDYALLDNPSTSECTCRTGFEGYTSGNKFICKPMCSQMTGANGTNGTTCICSANYYWSDVGCTIDCFTIPNSQGINNPANPSFCLCNAGFNETEDSCLLDCSSNSFSNDILTSNSACSCTSDAIQYGRICAQNCAAIPYADPSIAPNSAGQCTCRTGYFYSNNACWKDCALDPNSDSTNLNVSACNCKADFIWNGDFCFPDCTKLVYSKGPVTDVYDQCQCSKGYQWDKTLRLCVADNSDNKGVRLGVGLGVGLGLGIPLLLAAIAAAIYFCSGAGAAQMMMPIPIGAPMGFQPAMQASMPTNTVLVRPPAVPQQTVVRQVVTQQAPPQLTNPWVGAQPPQIIAPRVASQPPTTVYRPQVMVQPPQIVTPQITTTPMNTFIQPAKPISTPMSEGPRLLTPTPTSGPIRGPSSQPPVTLPPGIGLNNYPRPS